MKSKILIALLAALVFTGINTLRANESLHMNHSQKTNIQTTCPVMGGAINKKLYHDYKGKRIYVCCAECLETLKKDPEKYIDKLEKSGVVLEKAKDDKKNTEDTHSATCH
ncbi:MAG: hypothetical protein WC071_04675 [Victivallaceae bacterium]